MQIKGISSQKKRNQLSVITFIQKNGPVSRKEISQGIGLTRASITQLTTELIDAGLINELGSIKSDHHRAGRKEILLDFNYNHSLLGGIAIETDRIDLGLTNLKGESVARCTFDFDTSLLDDFDDKVMQNAIAQEFNTLLIDHKINYSQIGAVGIGVAGRRLSQNFLLSLTNMRKNMQSLFGAPLAVENNVRALAEAENLFFPKKSSGNFLFCKFGPGLGGALILSGSTYLGKTGMAGEIGHMRVGSTSNSTLENLFHKSTILEEIEPVFTHEHFPELYKNANGNINNVSSQMLYETLMSSSSNSNLWDIFLPKIAIFTRYLFNVYTLLDIDHISLYFQYNTMHVLYDKIIIQAQKLDDEFSQNIFLSPLSSMPPFLGGCAIAMPQWVEKFMND